MRKVIELQAKLGTTPISEIKLDLNSRDEIPKVLMGLQNIYRNGKTRKKLFRVLKKIMPKGINSKVGRRGMDIWQLCVLGVIRLSCNWDYDKLHEMANNHKALRQMLGHGIMDDDYVYALQTLKDNVRLLTQEHLDQINQIVVEAGHELLGRKASEELQGKCDSFVVETNVHYPTDANLLYDAIRKIITLASQECKAAGIKGWGKSKANIKKVKKHLYRIQNLKRSTSQDEKKKKQREEVIRKAYSGYIETTETFVTKAAETIIDLMKLNTGVLPLNLLEIEKYMNHARRQIDQIERRVCDGEKIPHGEKVFSLFEEHTEWICKGKAGIPQELGLRVCIVRDQHGFILYHHVMEKQTDDKVGKLMVDEAKARFCNLSSCSFDKGFYSPQNLKDLLERLEKVVLPKKGKLSSKEKEIEQSEEFLQTRKKHSSVESTINALEHSGLDRCPDHGINGFKRYVGLSILARNIQTLGNIIQQKQLKKLKRCEKRKCKAA
jgi:hypothetical protein